MIRILVADDHEMVRRGLRNLIERQYGWAVVAEATNGLEAVSKAIEFKPDVAILDYAMPMMNGVEVTRQIRTRLSNTEVLVFTMHESDTLVGEFLQAGARAFIFKSEQSEQLIEGVKSLLNHLPYLSGRWPARLLEGSLQKQTEDGGAFSRRERVKT